MSFFSFDEKYNRITSGRKPHIESKCSMCRGSLREGYSYVVVVAATLNDFGALDAKLCDACEEKRQVFLEGVMGIQRGSDIEVFNGAEWRLHTVVSIFDKTYIVDHKGYCVATNGPHNKVRNIQSTLF